MEVHKVFNLNIFKRIERDIALYSKKGDIGCRGDTGNKASQVEGRAYAKSQRERSLWLFKGEQSSYRG